MKGGGFDASQLYGTVAGAAGAAGAGLGDLDPTKLASTVLSRVQDEILKPTNPLGKAVAEASTLKGKVEGVVTAVKEAPEAIAKEAAKAVDKEIVEKIKNVNAKINTRLANIVPPPATEPPPGPELPGESGAMENNGTPPTNDPGSTAVSGGGGYETVFLTKPVKDPLHVFYLDGRPIYFTDNGNGRVKIIPLHSDMQMATTSSRHKYSKKIKHARKHKSTKKHTVRGVRKTSRKAKQHHSRRRR